ncbi:hypothetical protein C8J57DRAFT_1567250 [Mycena rebaudengoi]|nr:hypothetical protein C8J57DRAFT_1567250 [Mycena rebaudengoi]
MTGTTAWCYGVAGEWVWVRVRWMWAGANASRTPAARRTTTTTRILSNTTSTALLAPMRRRPRTACTRCTHRRRPQQLPHPVVTAFVIPPREEEPSHDPPPRQITEADDLHVRPARCPVAPRRSTAFGYAYVAKGGMTVHGGELVRSPPPLRALPTHTFPFPFTHLRPQCAQPPFRAAPTAPASPPPHTQPLEHLSRRSTYRGPALRRVDARLERPVRREPHRERGRMGRAKGRGDPAGV